MGWSNLGIDNWASVAADPAGIFSDEVVESYDQYNQYASPITASSQYGLSDPLNIYSWNQQQQPGQAPLPSPVARPVNRPEFQGYGMTNFGELGMRPMMNMPSWLQNDQQPAPSWLQNYQQPAPQMVSGQGQNFGGFGHSIPQTALPGGLLSMVQK